MWAYGGALDVLFLATVIRSMLSGLGKSAGSLIIVSTPKVKRSTALGQMDGSTKPWQKEGLPAGLEAIASISDLFVRERDGAFKAMELIMRLNEQAASFSEKIILLDGATITLSLTLLGSAISKSGHVGKTWFLLLVCPSWLLLLVSVFCSWVRMRSVHNANVHLYQSTRAHIENLEHQQLNIALSRLKLTLENLTEPPTNDASFAEAEQKLDSAVNTAITSSGVWQKKQQGFDQEAMDAAKNSAPFAVAAVWTTMVGLLLLCAFAVKLILAAWPTAVT